MTDRANPGEAAPELLPLRKMAARLGVPCAWLRERAEAGEVPALRAGNRWLFREDAAREAVVSMAAPEAMKGGKL